MDASGLLAKIATEILNPAIGLLFGAAILFFVWGIAEYVRSADEPAQRATGAKHMMWGLIGIFVMVSAVAILKAFTTSIFGQ